jgi:hypothetical protein
MAQASIQLPLPQQRAFELQPLPPHFLKMFNVLYNTLMNTGYYDIRNANDYANFRENLRNQLLLICWDNPILNSGIYDFSKVNPLIPELLSEIADAIYCEGRQLKQKDSSAIMNINCEKLNFNDEIYITN